MKHLIDLGLIANSIRRRHRLDLYPANAGSGATMRGRIRITPLLALSGLSLWFAAFAMSACHPLTTSTLPLPTPLVTLVTSPNYMPTETSAATPSPTMGVTATPAPTAMSTATETKRAVSVVSRATATLASANPGGVFVSAIKIEPMQAKSNEPPQFTVTFVNTTAKPQTYRWFVKIYMKDQSQSFGETSKIESEIVPKTSQVKAFSDWKTLVVTDCLFVIARVFWVDDNNQVHEFLKSNSTSPATGFYVCP